MADRLRTNGNGLTRAEVLIQEAINMGIDEMFWAIEDHTKTVVESVLAGIRSQKDEHINEAN